METKTRRKPAKAAKTSAAPKKSAATEETGGTIESSQLMKLFEDELKDIYWAEKELTKAIPKMIKKATSDELVEALENHLEETKEHVNRVEQVFEIIGKKPVAKKCEAMAGLVKEATEIMDECEEGAMCDAGIISAGQKVEHYEIASYGTLRQFAETLDMADAVELLEQTLNEEKDADAKLSEVAMSAVNLQAAEEDEEEDDEEEESDESEDNEQ